MLKIDLGGKVALITGGTGGLGKAIASVLREAGSLVTLLDLAPPREPLEGVSFQQADVTDFESVGISIQEILARHDAIDFLVNNAGINRDRAIWNMTEEDWDAVLGVNLKGAFHMIHHLAPHFRARRTGCVVNISSINALRGKFGLANYSASKAGLIGLTKTVAKELGEYGVTVNAVAPGYILTPMTWNLAPEIIGAARDEAVLGRLAEPVDVANTVAFLCSDLGRSITGEVIRVDCGQYI